MFNKTKSSYPDFSLIQQSLSRIENEQVHQRKDLSVLNALLKQMFLELNLQKQADDYYQSRLDEHNQGEAHLGVPLEDMARDLD